MPRLRYVSALHALVLVCAFHSFAIAQAPRVLPSGTLPKDARLGPQKDLKGYFPFTPSKTPAQWAERAKWLKQQTLVGLGLWPMPTTTPANAVIHTPVDRGEYTVEHVYLESFPGHFVTGNLYRPKGEAGRRPGVLCPHGHWPNGRFYDIGPTKILDEIVQGAERFEVGGRSPLQSRCVQLARMGCVVFHYDMIGYADSQQLEHRAGTRPEMNTPTNWGYFSPQAEARLQTIIGLQSYNSIRALDWFCELPDVDPERIGVTGASGGGTQTFLLCAVDPRPAVAFPAVMVSTAMQGGCSCENACYLRVGTGNVELAALFAPKPLGMTGADDWTKEIATKGFPELQQLYGMLGAKDLVMAKPLVQFKHNYNYVSRAAMYGWFNKHLKLSQSEPVVEEDYRPLTEAEMTVWDAAHPKPPAGEAYERSLVKWITDDAEKQLAAATPRDADSLKNYRELIGPAVQVMIGRGLPEAGAIEHEKIDEHDRGTYLEFTSLLRYPRYGEEVPTVFLLPKKWNKQVVVWVHELGKSGLYESDGTPRADVQSLIQAGFAVASADLFGQGEFTADGQPLAKAPLVKSGQGKWATYAAYTFGYNHSLFSKRVHDVLSLVSYCRHDKHKAEQVHVIGLGKAGPWVAAALAQAGSAIDRTAIDTSGFRFAAIDSIDDPAFLPGAVKYGDLPGMLALAAPHRLWLAGEGGDAPALVRAAYDSAGAKENLTMSAGEQPGKTAAEAVAWLLK
jgi:dienelactone hydrolase